MKILIIMDPGIMIPLKGYGGHERLVEMFAKEYYKIGHEVHLLITTGSMVEGCTVHDFGREGFPPEKRDARRALPAAWKFLWKHRDDFDLVHNFGRLAYLLPILHHRVNKIMTYGREITSRNIRLIHRMGGKNIVFTACSGNLLSRVNAAGNWEVVYNAIEFEKYQVQTNIGEDAPLMFLGRIERIKGCHTAIAVAKETGHRLIIAGNISPLPEEAAYFKTEIEPFIDGEQIRYIGSVNDAEKNHWLGKAKALLFPIEWNEPFGIVMIEAMACGTPVIGYNRGSVNEVIDEGITGFKVNNYAAIAGAIKQVGNINRKRVREVAAKRFDVAVIAKQYLYEVSNPNKKIVIVTTGQPSANPRVLKEYEAFKQRGYPVKVLYTYSLDWSYKIDEEKFRQGHLTRKDFILVGGNPHTGKMHYFLSRALFRTFKIMQGLPLSFIKDMAASRPSFYLWLVAKKYPADIYIAHYPGALPAASRATIKNNARLVFDAEDFHRGETTEKVAHIKQVIALENKFIPGADLITASSPLIGKAYKNLYPSKRIITINNVFSKKYLQLSHQQNHRGLSLFWFSQHIGPNRGLEKIVEALNLLNGIPVTLHLLGNTLYKDYIQSLLALAKEPEKIYFLDPVPPDNIFNIAATFDIGLAAEMPDFDNRNYCLTNKIFTYLLAGNCILASDTIAQRDFLTTYPGVGLLYRHNSATDLANKILGLYSDREYLDNCKKNATALAQTNLNWEMESEKFIVSMNTIP